MKTNKQKLIDYLLSDEDNDHLPDDYFDDYTVKELMREIIDQDGSLDIFLLSI